jgi:deoxyadenosine/deoxycytidine kinase
VAVIGSPGAGKSTLLKHLDSGTTNDMTKRVTLNPYVVVQEPVDRWEESGLLKKFYENPQKYAFEFQTEALVSMAEVTRAAVNKAGQGQIVVLERDIASSDYIFAEPLRKNIMSEKEAEAHRATFDAVAEGTPVTSHYIWLNVPPETCFQRMKDRGRESESEVELDYLKALDERIREWVRKVVTNNSAQVWMVTTETQDKLAPVMGQFLDLWVLDYI